MSRHIDHADRSGRPCSVVILDIDDFKRINDHYGHDEGDRVLRLLAAEIRWWVRQHDVVGRWGGEEFVLVLPDTHLRGAATLAENPRRNVENMDTRPLPAITASFGVAGYRIGEAKDALFKRADQCLYAAKEAGKDQVIASGDPERRAA